MKRSVAANETGMDCIIFGLCKDDFEVGFICISSWTYFVILTLVAIG